MIHCYRRQFGAAATAATLCALGGKVTMASAVPEREVFISGVRRGSADEDIARAVRSTLESAGNLSWLKSGDRVLIKPASNSGNPYPATTSAAGLAAVVRALRDKGAKVVVSDTAGVQFVKLSKDKLRGSTRKLMADNGLARAALEAGAELYFPEEEGWDAFVPEEPDGGGWKNPLMMPRVLREVDHIILMPRVSRHTLAGSTLGLKAAVGYWRTDTRLEYHRDAATLQEKTAEAMTVPALKEKQRLVLTVADRIQTTFGPDQGYNLAPETGLIFASESIVAHDMVALAFLLHGRGLTPEREKSGLMKDPYTSRAMVQLGNRAVTWLLGGAKEAARMQPLGNPEINSIWDDRVLKRAFELSGGVPRPRLTVAGDMPDPGLAAKLQEMVALPA